MVRCFLGSCLCSSHCGQRIPHSHLNHPHLACNLQYAQWITLYPSCVLSCTLAVSCSCPHLEHNIFLLSYSFPWYVLLSPMLSSYSILHFIILLDGLMLYLHHFVFIISTLTFFSRSCGCTPLLLASALLFSIHSVFVPFAATLCAMMAFSICFFPFCSVFITPLTAG